MSRNEEEANVKYCSNCRRDIPVVNYVMHSAYCYRNLKLCPICDEPILTIKLEDHLKTLHINVTCDGCLQRLQAIDLESHKINHCLSRLITCDYCNIQTEASKLPEHIEMCSSRTEKCNDCGQFIMLKYLETHKKNHEMKIIPNVTKQILDDSSESLAAYPPLSKKVPNTHTEMSNRPTLKLNDPRFMTVNRVSPIKRNNDQPQINTLNNNDDSRKAFIKKTNQSNDEEYFISGILQKSDHNKHAKNINLKNVNNVEDCNHFSDMNVLKGVKLPCEFCHKMINSENLVLHETGCRPDLATFHNILHSKNKNVNSINDNYPIPPLDLESSNESEINLNNLSLSSDEDENEKKNVEKLPCEFCEDLVPLDKLIGHQIMCEKVHLDIPKKKNLENYKNFQQLEKSSNNLKSNKELKCNVFESKSVFRESKTCSDSHLLDFSDSSNESSVILRLPRAKLHKEIQNNVVISNNHLINNTSARNNYVQFLSNSRLNNVEVSTREDSLLCFNPSGGAIPKQKSNKQTNNHHLLNNFSKRRGSGSSSD
ncbi:TRAF-type zinc finger domain-containing protein 1-like isoform X2 [Daktulosphaira vitifoliae]|uniref:TRAF-type zinc finger domain-containing protein 1-like isoform X2 n=1 Tax=Daktulosphaira vitifoliae TaxID=58002 RepID=UPI0021A9A8DE|nr:TRAF-type zinc finger domain-containing protein 1-like isoform X2 [Daktulosphaira vitifoliae]